MNADASAPLRQLCYRLRRQGMLELDAWLEPLAAHLTRGDDPALAAAAFALLAMEPPQLLALMHGEQPLPAILLPWLGLRR
jgi:succinate dehydrogenase flavin-adding protein (antitoxin of CptAB toxin-antitoxin module)